MMSSRPMMMTYSTPQYMPVMTNATNNTPNNTTTTTTGTAQLQAPSIQNPSLSTWAAQPTYAWTGPQQQQQQQQQMMMNACSPGAMAAMMNQGSPSGNNVPPMFVLTNSANATPTTSSHAPVSHTSSSSNSTIPHTGAMSPASPMAMSMSGADKNNNNTASTNVIMRQNNTPPFVPRMPCAETPYVLNGLPVTFTEVNNNNHPTTTAMMMGGAVSANTAPVTQQQQQQCPMTPAMTTTAAPYNLTAYLTTASATTTNTLNNNNSNGGSYITLSNTPPTTASGTMMMMPMTTAPTTTAYSALGSEAAAAAAAPPPAMITATTLMQPTVLLPSTPFDGTVFLQALPTATTTTTTTTTVQPMPTTAMMMMPPPPPPEEHRWNGTQYELNGLYEGYVKRYNPVRGFGFLTATHRLLPKTVLHIPHFPQEMGNEGNNSTTTTVSDHAMTSSVTTTPTMGDALHDVFASQSLEPQLMPMSVTGSEAMYGLTNAPPRPVSSGLHFHRIPVILGDIFVHQSYLMMRGFRSLPLSGRVRFRVGPMPGRSTLQAIEVELLPQVVPADIRRSMMTEQQQQQQQQPSGPAENSTNTNNDNMTLMSRVTSVNDTSRCGQEEEDKLCGTQNSAAMTESPPLVTASLTGLSVAAAEHTPRGTLTLPFSEQQQLLLDSGFYDTVMDESDPLTLGHLAFSMEDIVLGEDGTQAQSQHGEAGKHSGSGFDISLLDFDNRESEPTRETAAAVTHQPRYTAYQQVMRH